MKVLSGKSLNAFTVSGQAFKFERKITTVSCIHTPSAEDEAGRFAAAQQTALEQLHELRDTAVSKVGKQLAKIFDIHMVLTLDDDFSDAVRSIISTQRVNAEYAVSLTSYNFSKIFAAMDDDYMKARSADIHDISDRLVSILSGRKQKSAGFRNRRKQNNLHGGLSPQRNNTVLRKQRTGLSDGFRLVRFAFCDSRKEPQYSGYCRSWLGFAERYTHRRQPDR